MTEISAGDYVYQYGQPIGTSRGIAAGEWVTHENMSNDVPVVRDLPEDLHTPALVVGGATVVVFTTGNGTTIGNAIAPVIKLASNNRIFEKMNRDIDLSAGNVIEGTETIDEVGERVFEYIKETASGKILAKAEENKHREFQFWAEQTVTL